MRILAIDQGAKCGWATNKDGLLQWGTEKFHLRRMEFDGLRLVRFDRWLSKTCMKYFKFGGMDAVGPCVDLIISEGAVQFVEGKPNLTGLEYVAVIKVFCARNGIRHVEVAPLALKAFAIPDTRPKVKRKKGDPPRPRVDRGKPEMVAAARNRLSVDGVWGRATRAVKAGDIVTVETLGHMTDDQADALWLYWYAQEKHAV